MPRNTRTGGVLENMVLPALAQGGYTTTPQVIIGNRLSGRKHKVDVIAEKDGKKILISLKWQQVGGTAEEKVPYEVICLAKAVNDEPERFEKGYVVLGGDGWTLREFYVSGELRNYLKNTEKIEVLKLEPFVGLANKSGL